MHKEVQPQITPDVIMLNQDVDEENENEVQTIHSDIVHIFKLYFRLLPR
jgi:hypothetical protein